VMIACITEGFTCANPESAPAEQGVVHAAFDRIESLDYWRAANDAHVKTYLDWVEDPNGRSMFANVEYSFGLGYTLPAFVTNAQLRKSRWSPWAKESENRIERQGSISLDVVLYSLLGVNGNRKSALFDLSVRDQDGNETKWVLPILTYGTAKDSVHGFAFARQAFTDETGDWRARSKAYLAGDEESSLKKLVSRVAADDALRAAIAREAQHYFGVLAMQEGLRERDVQKAFVDLHDWLEADLKKRLEKLANYEIDYKDHVDQLVARALALSKMSREGLAAHFKG